MYYEKDIQTVCFPRQLPIHFHVTERTTFRSLKKLNIGLIHKKINKIEIIPARRFTISPALDAVMRSFLILCHLGSDD